MDLADSIQKLQGFVSIEQVQAFGTELGAHIAFKPPTYELDIQYAESAGLA